MKRMFLAVLFLMGCGSVDDSQEADSQEADSQEADSQEDGSALDAVLDALADTGVDVQPVDGSPEDVEMDENSGPDPLAWHEACPVEEREQRLIDVGDVTLNVACRGSGPTVVFLHGFPEFHYGWNKVMDELAGEFRLVAPDQRGYNISDKPEAVSDYALPFLVEDILNLLPLISPEPVILVAHDWGGPVGWLVAHSPNAHIRGFVSTNGPHPMRFAELIANNPEQATASEYMQVFRSPLGEQLMTPESLSTQFSSFLSPEELAIYVEAWSQPGAITGGLNWYRANSLDPEVMATLMEAYAPTVSVPAVVMWGLDDEYVLGMNAEGLEPYVPDLEVFTFEGVDHWIAHHIPGEIADVIRALDLKTSPE